MPTYVECFCCDKAVRVDKPHWRVHMLTSGEIVAQGYESNESQGTFGIGPSCRKKYPLAYRVKEPHHC